MNRVCAYCSKDNCHCNYRYRRVGGNAFSCHNTSEETSAAEMKTQFDQFFSRLRDQNVHGAWVFSFTQYDDKKLAKRKVIP